jgi:AraC family transcriptional activator of tynA and feaB
MEVLFSTKDVQPLDRFSYWHDVACRHIVRHDCLPECQTAFQAAIQRGIVADIDFIVFENSPMQVSRTSGQISHATGDELFICRQLSGALALEQDGREVTLQAGDISLLDPLMPYSGRFSGSSNLLLLKIPRAALETRVGRTQEMVARSMIRAGADGNLTSAFLAMLPDHVGRMSPIAETIVKDQLLDLLALTLTKATGTDRPKLSSSHSLVLIKLRAAIEARLTDTALNAGAVCAGAGVTVRHANSVLAHEGTSIMRLVQARRLDRCRSALEDPLQAHRTLSEIAYAWGFSDMTHFSRRFKMAYGILPSACRRRATGGKAP